MVIKIYNTLTKIKEDFVPIQKNRVTLYVCGITCYDLCHIGHGRSAIVFDMITRYFRYRGYNILYVKNFTDIDDKIINKSYLEKTSIKNIAENFINEHNKDMDTLGIIKPTITPKATENIGIIIEFIKKLIVKNLAYVSKHNVYYSVHNFQNYGKLSGQNIDQIISGIRVTIEENKKNPLDFVLWKSSKKNEPGWDSPWGKGRPGWHIECSAMSQKYLGVTFDIHGGGEDLIFPHHENEIAQSEGLSGKKLANYWIHNGLIKISQQKMSKSLKNIFSIREILKEFHPEILRLFFLQTHYRNQIDFTKSLLIQSRIALNRCYKTFATIDNLYLNFLKKKINKNNQKEKEIYSEKFKNEILNLKEKFIQAMDDDFNSALAIGYLFEGINIINSYIVNQNIDFANFLAIQKYCLLIKKLGYIFGLFSQKNAAMYLKKDCKDRIEKLEIKIFEIEKLINERNKARTNKNWEKADKIRSYLFSKKIILQDLETKTIWKIKD